MGSEQDSGILGEVVGVFLNYWGERPAQIVVVALILFQYRYTGVLLEVWAAAWALPMPITARGGRRRAIFAF